MASIIDPKNISHHAFFKFEKVGDSIEGTYIRKRIQFNKMAGKKQAHYLIQTEDGDAFWVAGKGMNEPQIIEGMEESFIGDTVALVFEELVKSKTPGYHDFKKLVHYRVSNGSTERAVANDITPSEEEEDVLPTM